MNGLGLFLNDFELKRAQQRISSDKEAWKSIAAKLLTDAETQMQADSAPLNYDCGWFDADPQRDFAETYNDFHDYAKPIREAHTQIHQLAQAGILFSREDMLACAYKRWMDIVENFSFRVRHHDSGMLYSFLMVEAADMYYLLHNLTDSQARDKILAFLKSGGQAIETSLDHWLTNLSYMPYNNHLAHHQAGLLACGIVLDCDKWISGALDGPGSPGHMLAGCVMDDGLCYESSTLYHFGTAAGLFKIAEISRHILPHGRNLYGESGVDNRSLKQMLDAPLGMLMPDGKIPAFGDCYGHRPNFLSGQAGVYELGYAIWGDPRYAWLLNRHTTRNSQNALLYGVDEIPSGDQPDNGSRIWLEHGWTMASSRRGDEYFTDTPGGFAVAVNGDKSCVHHNRDKFTIHLCADGISWLGDSEITSKISNAFNDPVQEQFNRAAWAHSQLIVNGREQNTLDAPLSVVRFRDQKGFGSVALADTEGRLYDGVKQMRCLNATEQFCLDLFYAKSETDIESLDWSFQPLAEELESEIELKNSDRPDNCQCPVLNDFKCGQINGNHIKVQMKQSGKTLSMDLSAYVNDEAGPADTLELHSASWPEFADGSGQSRRMYFARIRNQRKIIFAALYQLPNETKSPWAIESLINRHNGSENEIHIKLKSGSDTCGFVIPVPLEG